MPTKYQSRMDILLPPIRQACITFADDIAAMKRENYDSYIIAFRPKVRAFVEVTGPFLESLRDDPVRAVEAIRVRMEQVQIACEHAINEVFDKPQKDIVIEFSLGAQSPQPTL